MIETELTLNLFEIFNSKTYETTAKERGFNSSLVRGTGLGYPFVPKSAKANIIDPRGLRPV